jgi:anti-anti-sigma factor
VPLLTVVLVPAPDQIVVRVTGEADLSTAALLSDALAEAGTFGTRQVVVDVAAARFWDCSGLHALISFTAELDGAGRSCRIVGAPARTRRLIELAGVADELRLDGAVRELPAPNVVASLPPVAPATVRTGRPRRSVPVHATATGTPSAADLVAPVRG